MKTTKLIIIIAALLSCINLQAQDSDKKSSISFGWGAGHFKEQDLVISPLIHKGFSPVNTVIDYSHSDKLEHQLYLRFGLYKNNVIEPFTFYWHTRENSQMTWPSSNMNLDINYSLGKSALEKGNLKLVLGGRLRNRLHPSDNVMGSSVLFGYYFSLGLDVWTQLSYSIDNKHEFKANIALPLFSMNSRSPYSWMDDEYFEDFSSHKPLKTFASYIGGSKMQSWGKSQSFDFDVNYYYSLSDKWSIGAGYWFSLNTNQDPKNLTSIENMACLNIKLKF